MPEVSVVVAARDAAGSLPALLAALAVQEGVDHEIVVADNGSRDDTGALARAAGARVVEVPRPGRARARNAAIAAARAPLVAFTDADCRPRPGWLVALVAGLAEQPLTGGPVVATTSERPNRIERLEATWRWDAERALAAGWWVTANLGARREALAAIGGFDAALPHVGEDIDLCLRARAAGFPLGWTADAIVEHPADTRLRPLLRGAYEHARSQDLLHRRHGLQADDAWRHPGALVRGPWALRHLGLEPAELPARERRRLRTVARLQYAARMAGSLRGRLAR